MFVSQITLAMFANISYCGFTMNEETKKTESRTVAFRISGELFQRYEAIASKERRRMSDVFRLALEDHISSVEGQQQKEAA
jgi:hypothetical protein